MGTQPKDRVTPEEYLARELVAETKSEYFNGEVFAMVGASPAHVLITTNIAGELLGQLRQRECRVYSADLRVKIPATTSYAYPDVVVVCGAPRFSDEQKDTLLNPRLIIEVLSESTEDWDRSGKFEHYRSIESFAEYVVIAQDRIYAEHWVRQPDGTWKFSATHRLEDTIELESLETRLALADPYEKVDLSGSASAE